MSNFLPHLALGYEKPELRLIAEGRSCILPPSQLFPQNHPHSQVGPPSGLLEELNKEHSRPCSWSCLPVRWTHNISVPGATEGEAPAFGSWQLPHGFPQPVCPCSPYPQAWHLTQLGTFLFAVAAALSSLPMSLLSTWFSRYLTSDLPGLSAHTCTQVFQFIVCDPPST